MIIMKATLNYQRKFNTSVNLQIQIGGERKGEKPKIDEKNFKQKVKK